MSKKRVEIETKAGGLGALPWNHWIPETFMFPASWNFLRGRHVVLEKEIRQLKRVIFTGHNTNIYYFHNWINKPSAKEMHYPRTLSEATKVARSGKYRQSKTVLSFKVIRMKAVWLKSVEAWKSIQGDFKISSQNLHSASLTDENATASHFMLNTFYFLFKPQERLQNNLLYCGIN